MHTEKSKPRFWCNPTQKPRVNKIFLEHILRPIQNLVSSLPDHFDIGVKMISQNMFLPLVSRLSCPRFWVLVFLCALESSAIAPHPVSQNKPDLIDEKISDIATTLATVDLFRFGSKTHTALSREIRSNKGGYLCHCDRRNIDRAVRQAGKTAAEFPVD